jgi:hypothetical protein
MDNKHDNQKHTALQFFAIPSKTQCPVSLTMHASMMNFSVHWREHINTHRLIDTRHRHDGGTGKLKMLTVPGATVAG